MVDDTAPAAPTAPNRPPPPSAADVAAYRTAHEPKASPIIEPEAKTQADPSRLRVAQPYQRVTETPQAPAPLPARSGGAPPARTALIAGDHTQKPVYDLGDRMAPQAPMMVVPVMPNAANTAAPAMGEGVMLRPAALMDPVTARNTLNGIVANAKNWMADFPHEAEGEGAAMLHFVRGLISQQRMRTDATAHGQDLDPQAGEEAKFVPPPEHHVLMQVREQARGVIDAFERAMRAANLALPAADQNAVTGLRQSLHLE